jgi:cyanophycinase
MRTLLAAACILSLACRLPAQQAPLRLIPIGGALRDDNRAVFDALLPTSVKRIVIVPYSSADAAAAGAGAAERFRRHRPDAACSIMPDTAADPGLQPAAAEMLGTADLIYFTGGDQSRLIPRLYAAGQPAPALLALRAAAARGAIIGGTSAGAACLSDPMFTGGGSEAALLGPASDGPGAIPPPPTGTPAPGDADAADDDPPMRTGPRLGPGLGLIQPAIMDSHFAERGRYGRMVAALEASSKRFGVGINENRAALFDGRGFQGIGDAAAIVVDAGSLRREGLSRYGIRLTLLDDGDRFYVDPPPPTPPPPAPVPAAAEPPADVPGPWDRAAIVTMLRNLARDPATPQRARSARFTVVLSADDHTRIIPRQGQPQRLSISGARLDILEHAAAPSQPPAPAQPSPHGLLIIAPRTLAAALEDFAREKANSLPTRLAILEDLLAARDGVDDPERLKRALYTAWRSQGVRYVLLVGDADVLPVRYMVLDRVTPAAFDYAFYPSDLYYADVARRDGSFDDWNARKDGFHGAYFGEVRGEKNKSDPMNFDQVDFRPELAVGRWPVSTPQEAAAIAAKSLAYEAALRQGRGTAAAAAVVTGGWVDARGTMDGLLGQLKGWSAARLYFKDSNPAFDTPQPTEGAIVEQIRAGAALVLHAGHGSDDRWDGCLSPAAIPRLQSAPALPILISAGCSTARFATLPPYEPYTDVAGVEHKGTNNGEVFSSPPPAPACYARGPHNHTGLGEALVRAPGGGAVVYIGCNTGSQPCGLTLLAGFVEALARRSGPGQDPPRAGDCWADAVSYYVDHERLESLTPTDDWYPASIMFQPMKFMFFGDPSVGIPVPRQ